MTQIVSVKAREVLDSRGNPTVEVEMMSDNGLKSLAMVPSGASTGEHEACELRDGDVRRYLGKGVLRAVENVNRTLAGVVKKIPLSEQSLLDETLIQEDGTPNKSRLGANALLGVSMAYAKLSAFAQNMALSDYFAQLSGKTGRILPVPMMNILNGGAHADNNLDLQEIMIVPVGFDLFSEALRAGVEIFHHLKKVLRNKKLSTAVGDEGGFAPDLASNRAALELIAEAVQESGYELGRQIFIALDAASSEFFKNGKYVLSNDPQPQKSAAEMVDYYADLKSRFPIFSIEDGLDQNDWEGWGDFTSRLGSKMQLVGDDLFVTNPKLLSQGIEQNVANAVLVKVNQIGTLTETLKCISLAQKAGYATVISHRSGETEDSLIADLAVGTDAGQIKTGSLCRTDRIAKYNQILRIEERLEGRGQYYGATLAKSIR